MERISLCYAPVKLCKAEATSQLMVFVEMVYAAIVADGLANRQLVTEMFNMCHGCQSYYTSYYHIVVQSLS